MRFDRLKLLGRGHSPDPHRIVTCWPLAGALGDPSLLFDEVVGLGDGAESRLGESMEDVASRRRMLRLMARLVRLPAGEARSRRRSGAPDCVIVVLGYHEFGDDGLHGISSICRAAVRRSEELAAEVPPRAVIFTGWSSDGGPAEADQMAEEWTGRRDVALICEPRAVNTAENAVRSLELVQAIDGASEVVLVCSIRHFPRVRFFFGRLYRRYGYRIRYCYVVRPLPSLPLVRHELSSIARMARDRRRALGLLDEADSG